ncbi:MAG: aminodeoxychorismate/anthranilate synthase component II [Candidatus Eisenbacteria bacterium]|nr:aminodeoxychorismate/anthranilate synthase component II [Candidatus Eisenbacteria bacterium]
MIAVIDNYDSFTYNLVQLLGELHAEPKVWRNDAVTSSEIRRLAPQGVIISPGPKSPVDTEAANVLIRELAPDFPILGVCLGHQCLGYVYGGKIVRAPRLMHGKTSMIIHNSRGIFSGLDNPLQATRYHSLILERETLPDVFEICAWTAEGEVMGIRHREHELWGVQFHPESILSPQGRPLLQNFLTLCGGPVGRPGGAPA